MGVYVHLGENTTGGGRGGSPPPYVGNTRSEEKNTILHSDLAYKWNILEPTNGISSEI